MKKILHREKIIISKWLSIIKKKVSMNGKIEDFYNISTYDYLTIFAINECGKIPLVKQFRPSYEKYTLEFPAGLIDKKISKKEIAKSEIIEETGLIPCSKFQLIGKIKTDTGRSQNYLYSYFVRTKFSKKIIKKEKNINLILVSFTELQKLIKLGKFDHALHLAVYSLASIKNFIPKIK
jgi:ADP-ribose pyrophosphatase